MIFLFQNQKNTISLKKLLHYFITDVMYAPYGLSLFSDTYNHIR